MSTDKATAKARLIAEATTARDLARTAPSAETREAAIQASARLSAWLAENEPRKATGPGCRAGRRQHAEQRARTAENMRRAAVRR